MIVLKEEDTRKTAIRFAKSISKNCVVCLNGDLGAGKTTFSRYFIQALIKDKKVTGENYQIPKLYVKMHYCIEAAIHQRIVRGRSAADRRIRAPPQRFRRKKEDKK